MAVALRRRKRPKVEVPLAPMIDCVFLLLIYFMVSSTLERQEADIAFQLPGVAEQSVPVETPDEQILEILPNGHVRLNDFEYVPGSDGRLSELIGTLSRFRQAGEANLTGAAVTLQPHPEATHQAIVRVLDACSSAGIDSIHFGVND